MTPWILLLLGRALAACPEPAVSEPAPVTDDTDRSVPFEGTPPTLGMLESGFGEWRVCGKVTRIEPHPERADHFLVTVAGPEGGQLLVSRSSDGLLPVHLGQRIGVHQEVERFQIHQVRHLTVLDGEGRLLLGYSEGGDGRFAPGWAVGVGDRVEGPEDPEADRVPAPEPGKQPPVARAFQHEMVFAFGGRVAKSRGDLRLLETDAGRYVVRGSATRWSAGRRPPDTSNYAGFSIVRLPEPDVEEP